MRTRWKLILTLAICAIVATITYTFSNKDGWPNNDYEVVNSPNISANCSAGYIGQTLVYTIDGASSSKDYSVKYCIDWGDNTYSESNFVDSGAVDISHTWDSPGTYYIKVQAISASGASSSWSTSKEVAISEPEFPPFLIANIPSGPSTGEVDQVLSYSTGASSNIGGSPQYRFDWGDGSYSGWSSSCDASHSWANPGTYMIKAQAKFPSIISEWSAGKDLVIKEQALSREPYPNCRQMKRYITPDDPAVRAAIDEILGQPLQVLTDFETLRTWVALHVSYKHDIEVHGVKEYWQLPSETLELHTGDCEDFAILLCSLLRAYGVPADEVYVGLGFDEDDNGHAYLIERYYEGIWRVTESEADAWSGWFFSDWFTEVSYKTLYCFNDQYCFTDLPTLPSGVYEFQLSFLTSASAVFERYMNSGQTIVASIEWLPRHGQLPNFSIFGWGFKVYDASGSAIFSWFGGDLNQSFNFMVTTSGKYKVSVYIQTGAPSSVRLTIDPPDWSRL